MAGILRHWTGRLKRLLGGPALYRALDRNARAADELDRIVREVLHR